MKSFLVASIAVLALGWSAGVALAADNYLIQLDDRALNDSITANTFKNGNPVPVQSLLFQNDEVNASYDLFSGATLINTFDNQFNYYEKDGKTLSDTVEVSGTAGNTFFNVAFLSDPNSLSPLPNGGFNIENGQFQQGVLAGIVSNGDFYNLEIASDINIPEPATWALMLVGFLGIVFTLERTRIAPARPTA